LGEISNLELSRFFGLPEFPIRSYLAAASWLERILAEKTPLTPYGFRPELTFAGKISIGFVIVLSTSAPENSAISPSRYEVGCGHGTAAVCGIAGLENPCRQTRS
jgi:hypothetical protein